MAIDAGIGSPIVADGPVSATLIPAVQIPGVAARHLVTATAMMEAVTLVMLANHYLVLAVMAVVFPAVVAGIRIGRGGAGHAGDRSDGGQGNDDFRCKLHGMSPLPARVTGRQETV